MRSEAAHDWRKRRDNRSQNDRFYVPQLDIGELKQTADEHAVFIGSLAPVGRQAPTIAQDSTVEEATDYVGVPDINGKKHGGAPSKPEWRRDRDLDPGGGISHPLA